MAVMERVDTNTETEASSGMVLQRADTGYQVQKLQGKALIMYLNRVLNVILDLTCTLSL